jgi:L-threonylcarbamoyladenylate synthase
MQTEVLLTTDSRAVPRALEVLRDGGLVVFPTDTVYGVAGDAFSAASIERLFEAKGRDSAKAIAVLIGEVGQLAQVTATVSPAARKLAERFWPGALTLVVGKHPALPENISPQPTIGVRLPDHPFARALLRAAGPLAATSANLSGRPSATDAQAALQQLGGRVELLLDGGATPGGVPSTVVDCTAAEPAVLRLGPISEAQIKAALLEK